MNITINPALTTTALGSFGVQWDGLIQGTAYPDPSDRFALNGGLLATTETLSGWGGMALYEDIATPGNLTPRTNLGNILGRANSLTGSKALAAFSVFDQAYAMINSPQSPVQLTAPGQQLMYYRLGSGARIAVACDPILASLRGGPIGAQVSWDWVNELLVPYNGSALTITSGTYDSTTGIVTLVMSAAVDFSPGDAIVVSGLTGSGAYASLNGTFTALTAAGTGVTYNAGAGLGAAAITGGSLTLGSGSASAIPVKVLDVQTTNCMTVAYDPISGFATWNRNGSAAVIQL